MQIILEGKAALQQSGAALIQTQRARPPYSTSTDIAHSLASLEVALVWLKAMAQEGEQ